MIYPNQAHLNTSFLIGQLKLSNRLIQGPLAGVSCAPFRSLFSHFKAPAYAVSEMLSAHDVVYRHQKLGRYLYRSPDESILAYQIAGSEPGLMADAAVKLLSLGADLIDINCGCPKPKMRKKGAGSALAENPDLLIAIVKAIRTVIPIPLTVKLRLQETQQDIALAKALEDAGANALTIHARQWRDDYDIPCDLNRLAQIKQALSIPIIANGDIGDKASLDRAIEQTGCDGFMISRAGVGKPWLFQSLLGELNAPISLPQVVDLFMTHLEGLASLEGEYKALLQSRHLVRYYFRSLRQESFLSNFYKATSLQDVRGQLLNFNASYNNSDST
jgi:tRNA-dihydrouridine synthase B